MRPMRYPIYADFDDNSVVVYQAFRRSTVVEAQALGTFGRGFGFERTSWIKPSLGWIVHRTRHASRRRMDGVARIRLCRKAFDALLLESVETKPRGLSEDDWRRRFQRARVIHQWDPDRALDGRPLDRRALQLGLRGREVLQPYVDEWIRSVTDVTEAVRALRSDSTRPPELPEERIYPWPSLTDHA